MHLLLYLVRVDQPHQYLVQYLRNQNFRNEGLDGWVLILFGYFDQITHASAVHILKGQVNAALIIKSAIKPY